MDMPAQTKAEQAVWYKEARVVQERIQGSAALDGMPHSIWHFLSDADVRAKAPEIREQQFEQLRGYIVLLATGVIPPDDSHAVSWDTLFGELWDFIRGKKR